MRQIYTADKFQMYDYGKVQNRIVYGDITPPQIEIDSIKVPLVIFTALNDQLSPPSDQQKMLDALGYDKFLSQTIFHK